MQPVEYKEILSSAIQREVEAQNFYKQAAEQMPDGFLKELFTSFVSEEKKHEDILKGFLDAVPDSLPFEENRDYRVAETVETPRVSSDMAPADAFALAMKKEEEAMNQYNALADGCTDPEQAGVFRHLAAMERKHKLKMENAFVESAFPEAW